MVWHVETLVNAKSWSITKEAATKHVRVSQKYISWTQSSSSLSIMSLLGRFGAGLLTMLTGPVMNWNVHPDMDEMLTPAKTASRPLTKPGSDRIGSDRIGSNRTGIFAFGAEELFWEKLFNKSTFNKRNCELRISFSRTNVEHAAQFTLRLISVTVSFVSHSAEQTLNTLHSLLYV